MSKTIIEVFKTEHEKNEFIQKIIDKLMYCPGFKTELECIMLKYDIPKQIKLSHKPGEFTYNKT